MFGKFSISAVAVAAVFGLASAAANAAVIDYTSASTGASGTIGNGTTWTMTASGPLNNAQLYDGKTKPVGTGLSFERDGYGVGLKDDEITTTAKSQEWIEVKFSAPTLINAFYYLDLFVAKNRFQPRNRAGFGQWHQRLSTCSDRYRRFGRWRFRRHDLQADLCNCDPLHRSQQQRQLRVCRWCAGWHRSGSSAGSGSWHDVDGWPCWIGRAAPPQARLNQAAAEINKRPDITSGLFARAPPEGRAQS